MPDVDEENIIIDPVVWDKDAEPPVWKGERPSGTWVTVPDLDGTTPPGGGSNPTDATTPQSIVYSGTPKTTTYTDGQEFDPTGLTFTATMKDGSSVVIPTSDLSFAPSPLTTGTTLVTVSYTAEGETVTVVISGLTVNPKAPTPGVPGTGADGSRTYDAGAAGTFIEIATNGGYSLILRDTCLSTDYTRFNDSGNSNSYLNSTVHGAVKTWWSDYGYTAFAGKAVKNNVADTMGTWANMNATNNFSVPEAAFAEKKDEHATFLLSFGEAAKFCSTGWFNGSNYTTSTETAPTVWNELTDRNTVNWWLRSDTSTSGYASVVRNNGPVGSDGVKYGLGVRPALWVRTDSIDWQ